MISPYSEDGDSEPGPSRQPAASLDPTGVVRRVAPPAAEASSEYAGEKALLEYKDQGYELYLVTGIGGVGKTQLLHAYQGSSPFLSMVGKADRPGVRVIPTLGGSISCYTVADGTRKIVFVDVAGEDLRTLDPRQRSTGIISDADTRFLKLMADSLQGLVLVIDLRRLWGYDPGGDPGNPHQERILAWILEMLRWFHFDGKFNPDSAISYPQQITARVKQLGRRRRLGCPVQVIFSKADQQRGVFPPRRTAAWMGDGAETRALQPLGESPLLLAYHLLPELYSALRQHARHFRFDFAHSLVLDAEGNAVVDETSCGVEYSFHWLLRRPRAPVPGTHMWVQIQRTLDRLTFRGARWKRLPEPKDFTYA